MSLHRRVKDESVTSLGCVLLWVWFACWLCSSVLVPWASLCVCSPWRGCWAGEQIQGVLGAGSSILLTPQSRHCALMLPSRVWTHIVVSIAGECCRSLKGKKTQPKNPSPEQKGLGGCSKSIAVCNDKETSERTGQGEIVRTSQQCGHSLGCRTGFGWCAHEKWCGQGSTGSLGMLLGLPLNQDLLNCALNLQKNTLSAYSRDPEQISGFCFLLIPWERSSLLSHGSVLI